MSSYVLVHGAWGGGWYWKKLLPLLHAQGHEVYAATLTGLGERVHLANPEIGLGTHVHDVVNLLAYEDLSDVILVGHSYGGMVITGVADCVPERIAHLAYLDAFVPEQGQSLVDLIPAERRAHVHEQAEVEGDGWRVPRFGTVPWKQTVREIFHVDEERDVGLAGAAVYAPTSENDDRAAALHQPNRAKSSANIHSVFVV